MLVFHYWTIRVLAGCNTIGRGAYPTPTTIPEPSGLVMPNPPPADDPPPPLKVRLDWVNGWPQIVVAPADSDEEETDGGGV